jgi:hypothetical protein
MHVVKTETGCTGKIGVKQMFVACIVEQNEDGSYVNIDDQDLVNFDEIYHNESLQELEQVVSTKSFASISMQEETPKLSLPDTKSILEILKSRIVKVD